MHDRQMKCAKKLIRKAEKKRSVKYTTALQHPWLEKVMHIIDTSHCGI